MSEREIILVGGPDSGKTNYLARVWESIRSKTGALFASRPPTEITYVEEALEHLLKGEFAPRSDKNVAESTRSFSVSLQKATRKDLQPVNIVVPDVTGELWKKAIERYELPQTWMDSLQNASGALLFVRVGSDQNEDPLDWVTCSRLLRLQAASGVANDGTVTNVASGAVSNDGTRVPTQVVLCELLRFLEFGLKKNQDGSLPRVSVLITAWDRLDKETSARGPLAYLHTEYPMFAGRLDDIQSLNVKAFGVSVVSGDFMDPEFKENFFKKNLKDSGYVVVDDDPTTLIPDLTLPIEWVM
jgi:Double-GTPase 1